jgi:hypothetical protein
MNPKLPTIKDVSAIIRDIKPYIEDDYIDYDDTLPSIDITIGCDPATGEWSWQSGDNSYTGGAYFFPIWGVGRVYRRTNSRKLAHDLIEQIAEQFYA